MKKRKTFFLFILLSLIFSGATCRAYKDQASSLSELKGVQIIQKEGWSQIWVDNALAGALRDEVVEYRLSEDHKKLLFLDKNENLYVWNEEKIERIGESVEFFAWDERGKSFIYSTGGEWFFRDWNAFGVLSNEEKISQEDLETRYKDL